MPNAMSTITTGPRQTTLGVLLRLAVPSVANTLSLTCMQFVDGWMVSLLDRHGIGGSVNLAATFNGGMTAFVPLAFFNGLVGVVSTLASQATGRRLEDEPARYAWQGLWIAAVSGLIFWPLILALYPLFQLAGHTPPLLTSETMFASYMLVAAPLNVAATALGNFFLGLHKPVHQFTAGLIGNALNLLLDWLLIFGNLGCPRLNLLGAALATVVGSAGSLAVLLVVFDSPAYRRRYAGRGIWRPDFGRLWKLLRIGAPAGVLFADDILCWTIFTVAWIDHFGSAAAEAQSAVMRYLTLSFMPAVGLGLAVGALVGQRIGRGDIAGACEAAGWGFRLSLMWMGLCGLAFWLFGRPLAELLVARPGEISLVVQMLLFAAVFQIFDAMNVVYISALRSAGDTLVPSLVTMGLAWSLCVVGGGAMMHWFAGWGVRGPWAAATLYICLGGLWNGWRWKRQAWRRLDVLGERLVPRSAR